MTTKSEDYPVIHYLEKDKVPVPEMPFDHDHAGTTWKKKYGITEPPLQARGADGLMYDDGRFKGIFRHGLYNTIVHRGYTVVPNEEINEYVHNIVDKKGSGLHVVKQYFSHHGNASFWEILSDKKEKVAAGDEVQIGCIIRNSVGTYVALGADLFTYRLICSNGAIAKGHDLGSIAIRHIGQPEQMITAFSKGIRHILDRTSDLLQYYRQATKMKVNKQIAEAWAARIPQRVLPKTIDVDKNGKVSLLSLKGEAPNLWESFNDITANSWKNLNQGRTVEWKSEPGFLTKYHTTIHAHKILMAAVDGTLGKKKKTDLGVRI